MRKVTEFIGTKMDKYRKRLSEIKKKLYENKEYMSGGIILVHMKKRDFREIVQGKFMSIFQFKSIDYYGTNLGNFASVLSNTNEKVIVKFDNGSNCGNNQKMSTIVFIIFLIE